MAAKVRPCLVMSAPIADRDRAVLAIVPHTTATRGTEYEADVRAQFLKIGAFDAQGLLTIPVSRAIRPLGTLNPEQLRAVERVVCRWLQLPHDL
jgi:mRNA interferase MazF